MTQAPKKEYTEKTMEGIIRHRKRVTADCHKAKETEPLVIILDDLDFSWTKKEMNTFCHRWNGGAALDGLATTLRPALDLEDARDEVCLLALHLFRQGKTERLPERSEK